MGRATASRLGFLALVLLPLVARAQPTEKPDLALEALGVEEKIDLENIVLGAAKSVTTVQEAPGIVTVLSREEMQRRGFRTLQEALQYVPGWQPSPVIFHSTDLMLTRGAVQSQLLLRDGISLFDPMINVMVIGPTMPIEMIKRVEVVTGPGGVLWGANSFLGIISVLTRDAQDINGVEANAAFGHGPCDPKSLTPCGDSRDFKAYGIYGKAWGKLSLIQHVSFQTYQGPQYGRLRSWISARSGASTRRERSSGRTSSPPSPRGCA